MTTLTMRTNPMKRNNLWPQLDAASCSLESFDSKYLAGCDQIGGHPPGPC
ncbi:hypothetical protein [Myxococcus sp. AM010]|nr:hypothetical protein [Myxococcus sp. AM010]NVJ14059.1 hypothetical protein [Myxococcus sp. AM010]